MMFIPKVSERKRIVFTLPIEVYRDARAKNIDLSETFLIALLERIWAIERTQKNESSTTSGNGHAGRNQGSSAGKRSPKGKTGHEGELRQDSGNSSVSISCEKFTSVPGRDPGDA